MSINNEIIDDEIMDEINIIAEKNVYLYCLQTHQKGYHTLHINKDTFQTYWTEDITDHDQLYNKDEYCITIGTGSQACDCDICSNSINRMDAIEHILDHEMDYLEDLIDTLIICIMHDKK